eukprot:1686398-Rhodomonas_salina.1
MAIGQLEGETFPHPKPDDHDFMEPGEIRKPVMGTSRYRIVSAHIPCPTPPSSPRFHKKLGAI